MAVDTLRDFEVAFDGIDLDAITVSLTINGAAAILIAMYLAMAEKRGFVLAKLRGTAQNDILKEFIGRGTWMFPVDREGRYGWSATPSSFARERCRTVRVVSAAIASESRRDACAGNAGLRLRHRARPTDAVLARGLDFCDGFAEAVCQLQPIFGNLFEQVAKFRAWPASRAVTILERLRRQESGLGWLRDDASAAAVSACPSSRPENNIARGAHYALIAARSAAPKAMDAVCYDEAYTIPTPKHAAELAAHHAALITRSGLATPSIRLAAPITSRASQISSRKIVEAMNWVDSAHRQGGRRRHPGQK